MEKMTKRGKVLQPAIITGDSEAEIIGVPIPKRTKSYTPVSHKFIIDTVKDEVTKRDYKIYAIDYRTSNKSQRVMGLYKLLPDWFDSKNIEPDGLIETIAFRNSYDKSMAFSTASGANVFICANGLFTGELIYSKKHWMDVDQQVRPKIIEAFDKMEVNFGKAQEFRSELKMIEISERVRAELLGRLIFELKVLTSTQINVIKEQRRFSEHFAGDTAWDLFNNVTESLKRSNPILFHKNHLTVHQLFTEELIGKQ